ncbi:phosphopyruvate hydratase [Candidatus Babeliales bacterium]|nr:phosphopyruvate hydratase [Candidatus Babeliales bacterium]MBP9843366.1 phosphopyruvate hydratase [Candidatus Babeliales bacterium]
MNITNLYAYEIFDSRGLPTIECCIELANGRKVYASAPSGASVGKAEALELRDGQANRLMGKGVVNAITYINETIAPKFLYQPINALAMDSVLMDLDHHPQKMTIGANTTIAVSMALFKAQAASENLELYQIIQRVSGTSMVKMPVPMFNVINGGAHANNNLHVQEYMVISQAETYVEQLHAGVIFYQTLKKYFDASGFSTNVGDEGGFAPNLQNDRAGLELLQEIAKQLPQDSYSFALDVAASEIYNETTQTYDLVEEKNLTAQALTKIYESWSEQFPIISIEDGMAEEDIQGWQFMTKQLGDRMQLVGDDLFVTNPMKIRKGVLQKTANTVLIKPNQIGTVSQTLAAIDACKNKNLNIVISHRSGETNDTFICDLAVGTASNFIKAGAPARGERIAKYNRLLDINRMLYQ